MFGPEDISRREAIRRGFKVGTIFFVSALGIACSEPQDAAPKPENWPTPAPTTTPNPLPERVARPKTGEDDFNNRVLDLLYPGNQVDIWEGNFTIGDELRRRSTLNNRYAGCLLGTDRICEEGIAYQTWRSEDVLNPIKMGGGFVYFSPKTGLPVYVVVDEDNLRYIRKDGVKYENLQPWTIAAIPQTVTIEKIRRDEEDPLKRPTILARKQDNTIEQIMRSQSNRMLGFL